MLYLVNRCHLFFQIILHHFWKLNLIQDASCPCQVILFSLKKIKWLIFIYITNNSILLVLRILILGIHWAWHTVDDLRQYFDNFGTVEQVEILGNPRGLGFVVFESKSSADKCLEHGKIHIINGQKCEVTVSLMSILLFIKYFSVYCSEFQVRFAERFSEESGYQFFWK